MIQVPDNKKSRRSASGGCLLAGHSSPLGDAGACTRVTVRDTRLSGRLCDDCSS